MEEGSRPAASQASRTRSNAAAESRTLWNGTLNSSANVAASRGVRRAPAPPRRTGGRGRWAGFGSAGESFSWYRQPGTAAHRQVVIGSEERVKPEFLRGPRHRAQRLVVGALLRLSEDPEFHGPILPVARWPSGSPTGRTFSRPPHRRRCTGPAIPPRSGHNRGPAYARPWPGGPPR